MVLETDNKRKEANNLIIYHQNIRSLNKKQDEISIMLQECQSRPHLICLSEHHMRKVEMLDLTLPGYRIASCFCREKYIKGGVCILVRNDINCQAIDLNNICKEKVFEISAVRLDTCSTSMIICCVYRSPSEKSNYFLNLLEQTLNLLYQPTASLIICGDLNINSLIENSVKQNLETMMKTFNLSQVVTFPTRICNNKGSLIDNIFLDKTKHNNITVDAFDNGLSDHIAQILTLVNMKVPTSKQTYTRKTRVMDVESINNFQSHLREEVWNGVYDSRDVNCSFNNFHCTLIRHFENSFPSVLKSYKSKHNDWITIGIRISCQRKRYLYSIYKNTNSPQVKAYYKKYNNILKKVIINAKKLYYDKRIELSSNRVKTTWSIIKDLTGKTQPTVTRMEINCEAGTLTNINDIAKAFNSYFINITEDLNNNSSDVDKALQLLRKSYPESTPVMKLIPVTETEVREIIKSLKNKNSSGYDEISNSMLKYCVNEISKPLTYIFNLSLRTGVFPDRFKHAVVRPIHKKGDKSTMNNYRPVSLLMTCSKVLEKIMLNRLNHHLQTNEILALEQFGFRKGSNIENAVFALTDYILTSLNQRKYVEGIFCDLTKAFDCVNHEILLTKLHYYGIQGVCWNWFKTYITNRKQKVQMISQSGIQDSNCKWEAIKSGVPQGSILGPLLFVVYMNDLPRGVNQLARPVIYADDTSVLVSAKDLEELEVKVSTTLHHITDWFSINRLTLNMEKTNCIKFTANHTKHQRQQNDLVNDSIEEVTNTTFLGLELDKNINWKNHVEKNLSKVE